ncbi:(Fe-S)-binding protein [Thermophagus xiamenensis]|uniref:4Fe-4S domain-containing protein n=1 Tax=Thermophagus xiamenensis TaxID=385682 RepID=A0A1I1YKX5_9BACT|nr:(Fe-S)-binding protein [Thermophagus xiamenensis]SFE19688.1 hypothetical protein SAMN05444380_10822 [Thermophagus xiamenensis]
MQKKISALLPGFNCGKCGCSQCEDFALSLINGKKELRTCPVLTRPGFAANKTSIEKLIQKQIQNNNHNIIAGVIDNYKADIFLKPLKNEKSCRETLLPFCTIELKAGDIIKYRPLGCPITHIAKIIDIQHSLITVAIKGPDNDRNFENNAVIDVGICMVLAFQGRYEGKTLKVGETIRFLPHHCMMQKVHSGVVVQLEKEKVRIEIIDLKVWGMPDTNSDNPYISYK